MRTITVDIPEQQITVDINTLRPHTETFPATKHTYAPTLASIHDWLWGDCGPLTLSWQNGLLCPFNERVGTMNITCSNGLRQQCNGVLVTPNNAPFPPTGRKRLIGRVVCFRWCNVLADAYWDIDNAHLFDLPDDVHLVAHHIMRHIFRSTYWFDWRRELRLRQSGKPRRAWFSPIPT